MYPARRHHEGFANSVPRSVDPGWGSQFVGGAHPGPPGHLGGEVEALDDALGGVLTPGGPRQHPLHFELVAVGVGPVEAQGRAVRRLAGERARCDETVADGDELIDGVHLPRQVVQTRRPAGCSGRASAEAEESEIVMVLRVRGAQEGSVHAPVCSLDHIEAEHVGVKGYGRVEIRDEQHGMVEAADACHRIPFVG